MVRSALTPAAWPGAYTAAMVSASTSTSLATAPLGPMTVPPVMSVRVMTW
jgi:hypothetical protein